MSVGDAILVLVDKLLEEREKTIRLELAKKQQEEQTDEDEV